MSNPHDMTNDPAGEYKREPLLSDEALYIIGLKAAETKYGLHEQCMAIVAAISGLYESKITSGELMVVKEATVDDNGDCSECGRFVRLPNSLAIQWTGPMHNFCPGCGARIIQKP